MQEKRQIKSAAELVNAICKGLKIYDDTDKQMLSLDYFDFGGLEFFGDYDLYYSDPVEVVELWGDKTMMFDMYFTGEISEGIITHKQTQIHLNNKIIWTETEKI